MSTPESTGLTPGNRWSRSIRSGCLTRAAFFFMIIASTMGFIGALVLLWPIIGSADLTQDVDQTRLLPFAQINEVAERDAADVAADVARPGLRELQDEGPVFSVQPLANVEKITARMTLESIVIAGYSDFVMEGSDAEGYDVYMPGLTLRDGLVLEDLLKRASIIPEYEWVPNGFYVVESDNLR